MGLRWERLATVLLLACALTTTALVVRREFSAQQASASASAAAVHTAPVFRKDWHELPASGVRMGPADAAVQILEFADFECPFCRKMGSTLSRLRQRFPTDIAVVFVHLPLPQHRFAESASTAAECAGRQGRFESMHDILFESQQDFGTRTWSKMAEQAGVASSAQFEECMNNPAPVERIIEGKRLADRLSINGTPTLVVNGWQFAVPPSDEDLERMVRLILAGKSPVASPSS